MGMLVGQVVASGISAAIDGSVAIVIEAIEATVGHSGLGGEGFASVIVWGFARPVAVLRSCLTRMLTLAIDARSVLHIDGRTRTTAGSTVGGSVQFRLTTVGSVVVAVTPTRWTGGMLRGCIDGIGPASDNRVDLSLTNPSVE